MAVLQIPSTGLKSAELKLREFVTTNMMYGGETHNHEVADRRWTGNFQTRNLQAADIRPWRAFFAKLRGTGYFYAYDPETPYPQAYPDGFGALTRFGGGAFDGTADVDSFSGNFGVQISGLPVGFTIKDGDYIGIVEGENRHLHVVNGDVTSDSAGAVLVTVEPRILVELYTTAATVNFYKPVCVMGIDTYSLPRDLTGGAVTFTGLERLVP